MGSSGIPPPKQVFPYSIGGRPIIPVRTCLGEGGGGWFYNQNPPLGGAQGYVRGLKGNEEMRGGVQLGVL